MTREGKSLWVGDNDGMEERAFVGRGNSVADDGIDVLEDERPAKVRPAIDTLDPLATECALNPTGACYTHELPTNQPTVPSPCICLCVTHK